MICAQRFALHFRASSADMYKYLKRVEDWNGREPNSGIVQMNAIASGVCQQGCNLQKKKNQQEPGSNSPV
jgi:hypothetical protein